MPDPRPAVTPVPGPQPAAAPRRYRDVAELLAGATERTVLAEVPGKSGASAGAGRDQRAALRRSSTSTSPTTGPCARRAACGARRSCSGSGGSSPGSRTASTSRSWGPPRSERAGPPPAGGCALLMRDVSAWLVPATDAPIAWPSICGSCGTWPRCTPRSGAAATSSRSSQSCTATWSCHPGWRRRRQPPARRIWCRSWSARAGRCWPRWRRPPRRSSPRWRATRARWWMRSPPPRTRSFTATGNSTTSAPMMPDGRSCSTGNSPASVRR